MVFSIVYLLLLLFPSYVFPDIKGSFSTVSFEPFFTFPQNPLLDIANEMRGFGWFNNGFALQNSRTDCLFTGVFPVSGVINMNGGTYTLSQDFITRNSLNVQSLGTILGNGYTMDFCSTVTIVPAATFNAMEVVINNDVMLTGTLTFQGDCRLVGNGNTIYLGNGAGIVIDTGATLKLSNVILNGISDGNILCVDDSSALILDTVKWYQNGDYTFNNGSIQFVDSVCFFGNNSFTYASAYTSTIQSESTWAIAGDMQIIMGQYAPSGAQPLYMVDSTSQLKFSDSQLSVTQYGIMFTQGTLIFDAIVTVDDQSTSTTNGIIIGNGVSGQDPTLEFTAGASVLLQSSHLVFNTSQPNIIVAGANQSARIKRYMGSNIYLQTNLIIPSLSIEADSLLIPEIQLAANVALDFAETVIVRPDLTLDVTSARTIIHTYQLQGGDSLSLTRGTLSAGVYVIGSDNNINGNGAINGNITLQDQNAVLTIDLQGFLNGATILNGGTITLANNLQLGTDYALTGSGTINVASKAVDMPFTEFVFTASMQFIGTDAKINLNALLSFTGTMTVVGHLVLDGNGNVLDMSGGGTIYVQDNSSLTIKNTYLENLLNNSIVCLGDNARIIMDNSTVGLGSDIIFGTGSILFEHVVDIFGTYTLFYESTQTSTIDDDSTLHLRNGVQLVLSRNPISQVQPIYFATATSTLHLDNMALVIGSSGATITRGIMLLDNSVVLDIISTTSTNGLILGDGTPQDTTQVVFNAGATLNNVGGVLVYNIGNLNGIVSNTKTSQIIRSPASDTYLQKPINLSNISFIILQTPTLNIPTPQPFNYTNVNIVLPTVQYAITGQRYTNSANLLHGNGSIFMTSGTYPLGTVVSGTGNLIQGNGSIGGPVNFLNSSAQLQWLLNGLLIGNMSLNGGTLILGANMNLARGTQVNNGIVNLGIYSFSYGSTDLTITQNNYFSGNNGALELSANITLDAVWTFSQNCVLNGRGHTVYMGPGGAILVEKGSTLRLKDINIHNIAGNTVRCLDDAGTLMLDGVYWQQSGNFAYTCGSLGYNNFVEMNTTGTNAYVFAYQSSRTSTLFSNATLQLDSGFTFSYDPIVVASKNLLAFQDQSAELIMNSATLHATVTGMCLANGTLDVRGNSYFSSEIQVIDQFTQIDKGISLGNDVASNDMYVEIESSAILTVSQGSLHYRNVQPSSLYMFSKASTIYIQQGASLYLTENLPLGSGALNLQVGSQLLQANGVNVIGSIFLTE